MHIRGGSMSIGRAVTWFAAAYGLAIGGYLVLNAAAGRFLGSSSFGYFVAAITLTTVLGQVGLLGVHRSGLREAARLEHEDTERLALLRRGVRAVTLISLPLAGVAGAVFTWAVARDQDTTDRAVLAASVLFLVVLSGLQKLWANYLRGFGMVRMASMLEGRSGGALVGILQAAFVVVVWLVAPQWGLAGALAALALGYAIPVILASRAVAQHWGHIPLDTRIFADLGVVARRDWKFASVQVAALLNTSIDVWIAGFLLSSHDTAMLAAAQRLAVLVLLPLTALQVVVSPMISRYAVAGDKTELERILRTGATVATSVTSLLWLPLLLAPTLVLRLVFGSGFGDAALPLVLISSAFFVSSVCGLAGLTLSMTHREGVAAAVQWVGLVTRVLVCSAAAVLGGLEALAVTSAVVSTATFITMWTRTRAQVGVNTAVTRHVDLALIRRTTV